MFLSFSNPFRARQPLAAESLQIGARTVPLVVVRNPRARRYLLRVRPDGTARLTIPRGGNRSEAQSFVERNRGWLEQQLQRLHARPRVPSAWRIGSEILFRGEMVRIEISETGGLRVGTENLKIPAAAIGAPVLLNPNPEVACGAADASCGSADIPVCGFTGLSSPVFPCENWRLESRQNPQAGKPALRAQRNSTPDFGLNPVSGAELRRGDSTAEGGSVLPPGALPGATESVAPNAAATDLRPFIERHFRALASVELPMRVAELAAPHQFSVQRVTVRNQKSRWGSCSRRGTLSLNWRLIQTPVHVRDYIILHELAHLRQMNHSRRFWEEVERLCPEYRVAEQWLKANRQLLR